MICDAPFYKVANMINYYCIYYANIVSPVSQSVPLKGE